MTSQSGTSPWSATIPVQVRHQLVVPIVDMVPVNELTVRDLTVVTWSVTLQVRKQLVVPKVDTINELTVVSNNPG